MLPRLGAMESLTRAAEVAIGSGSMKKEDALSIQRTWKRLARDHKQKARKATTADLASLPIEITSVPVKES